MTVTKKRFSFGGGKTMDMTSGAIMPLIVRFAIPLLLGNLFQQLYNMVDTWVIGQTGVNGAYAAVGSVAPIINILIGFYSGFATGAGVIIAQYFGRKDNNSVQKAVHTTICGMLILCVAFTVLGVISSPLLLKMMLKDADSEVYTYAKQYLTIFFAGVSGLMIYNTGAGILRAIGDSRRPFYYLVVAAAINVGLDFLFVFGFNMGVRGVALATVIAQFASAALTLVTLVRTDTVVHLDFRQLKIDREMLGKIAVLGFPAALQMSITAFANVFVQGYIAGADGDQTYNLGGFTTYSKVDHFLFLPVQSLSLAVTTFVGQNIGVGNRERARRGTYYTIGLSLCIVALLILTIMLSAPVLAAIFNPDENVVAVAVRLLRFLTPFYLVCCLNQVFAAALRGEGNSTVPMITMLTCFVGVRQIYLFVVSRFISNDLIALTVSYPVGWISCALIITTFYHVIQYKKSKALCAAKVMTLDEGKDEPEEDEMPVLTPTDRTLNEVQADELVLTPTDGTPDEVQADEELVSTPTDGTPDEAQTDETPMVERMDEAQAMQGTTKASDSDEKNDTPCDEIKREARGIILPLISGCDDGNSEIIGNPSK